MSKKVNLDNNEKLIATLHDVYSLINESIALSAKMSGRRVADCRYYEVRNLLDDLMSDEFTVWWNETEKLDAVSG